MESNPKELRLENDNIDRISDLPDLILSKILCSLPTKNAVGTSILSTRWNNLFRYEFMPIKLDFDDSLLLNPREENFNNTPCASFMNFVDKLLDETLSGVNSVEEIILKCDKTYGEGKVVSWVCAALRLNVQHLDLKFSRYQSTAFFHSLNGCTTLVTLRLWVKNDLNVPHDFCLPNLKNLDLAKVIFEEEEDPVDQLIKGCPVLEYLYLFQCNMESPYSVRIRCPLLKKLVVVGRSKESLFSFKISAPNLEELIFAAVLPSFCNVCEFKSLHTAHINIGPDQERLDEEEEENEAEEFRYFHTIATIVSHCSTTSRLYLSDCTIDALHLSSMPLPLFHNLMWLSLGTLHWSILARLLQISPNLERLTIEEGFKENENGFSDFEHLLPIPPECLVLHVKTIEFWVFEGDEDEIKLVEYFLKNGGVLQNLILRRLPPKDMSILTRLLMLPRQSKTCQIDC